MTYPARLGLLVIVTAFAAGCHHTAQGVKDDTRNAVQKTGHGIEKAGEKVENAGKK